MKITSICNYSVINQLNSNKKNTKNSSIEQADNNACCLANHMSSFSGHSIINFKGGKSIKLMEPIIKLTKSEALAKGFIPVYNSKTLYEALCKAEEKKYVPSFLVEEAKKSMDEPVMKILLMRDIKLDTTKENNWVPIKTFGGVLNGNGYKISGLRINLPNEDNVGLFKSIKNAQIENLILNDVDIRGGKNTGAFVGVNNYNFNNKSETSLYLPIKNCIVDGCVTGTENVGGIVGDMNNAHVENCISEAKVNGMENIGGIIGENNYSKTLNNISRATVEGDLRVGGVAGYNVVSRVQGVFF